MAAALKDSFGHDVARRIAAMIVAVHPRFPGELFIADCRQGFAPLGLTDRARLIATVLARHLPAEYPTAIAILVASLGPPLTRTLGNGMAPFLYLPHVYFVAGHGLDHAAESLVAQEALTQRFTAEFSIRAFIERHPEATMARLAAWARHPSEHVRRLVSEGTRPRLPWAGRLRAFQRDPTPVLGLLEALKDDPSDYVRRSVANNLNDIGKDHPALLVATCRRWLAEAPPLRVRLVRHALRTAVKLGDAGALALLGCGSEAHVDVDRVSIAPRRVRIGGAVRIAFDLVGRARTAQELMVDLRVHYAKAAGHGAKVFKLARLTVAAGARHAFARDLSLRQLTTRVHHPGSHRVEALINGRAYELGSFQLLPER